MSTLTPNPIIRYALRDYFMSHAKKLYSCHYEITKDLPAFKKIKHGREYWHHDKPEAIVNLTIPVGARVFADDRVFICSRYFSDSFKMRASKARVHSIVALDPLKQLNSGVSGHDPKFRYRVGAVVRPTRKFDEGYEQCSSGIHFFLNVKHALDYHL